MSTFKNPVYESEHHVAGNINIFGHWYTVAIVKAIHNKSKSAEIDFMTYLKCSTSPYALLLRHISRSFWIQNKISTIFLLFRFCIVLSLLAT